ncbi:hypothetical protein DDT52_01310 [Brenneria roseae subsp. roseae]|nr:hypothetical protein DDT52_01310 [Brenneria roseae subsp. roseae]
MTGSALNLRRVRGIIQEGSDTIFAEIALKSVHCRPLLNGEKGCTIKAVVDEAVTAFFSTLFCDDFQ